MAKDGARDREVSRAAEAPDTSDYSEFKPVAVGIGIWVVLFALSLVFRHDLENDGNGWWVWTALAGVVEGGVGYLYLLRRASRMRARAATAPRDQA